MSHRIAEARRLIHAMPLEIFKRRGPLLLPREQYLDVVEWLVDNVKPVDGGQFACAEAKDGTYGPLFMGVVIGEKE